MMTVPLEPAVLGVACASACAVLALGHYRRRYVICEACEPCEEPTSPSKPSRLGHDPPASPPLIARGEMAPTPRQALIDSDHSVGLTKDQALITRRESYIDWHDYFMSVAMLSAFRSKDPSRQVGACIVDPSTKRIVGIGYNGFPWGW